MNPKGPSTDFLPSELIKKKKRGLSHYREEIEYLVQGYVSGDIPDYQISAWLMAVCFQGLNNEETSCLTSIMRDSGRVLDFQKLSLSCVDKHSTGGVGDKTSLILGPIAAAAEVPVAMIAGRGLGHTGGTLDKLESIPGFNVNLSAEEFEKQVADLNLAIMGQTEEICPADRKFYSLRDVTGTIDSLPLICASIMSKKLAEGIQGLILDVKYGSGAFMKTLGEARELAQRLTEIGKKQGVQTNALITNMNAPLGRFVGNSLEVKECLEILQGHSFNEGEFDFYEPTRELSLQLAGHMIHLGGKSKDAQSGYAQATELLNSGAAFKKFQELCQAQGDADFNQLPLYTEAALTMKSHKEGVLHSINVEGLGVACQMLKAGRTVSTDHIDPASGLEMLCRLGQTVEVGTPLLRVYSDQETIPNSIQDHLKSCFKVGLETYQPSPLIAETIFGQGEKP